MNAYFDVNDIPMFLIMLSVVWIVYAMIMKGIKSAYDTYVYPKEPVMELELHQQVIEQPTVAPVAVKKKRAPRKKKVVVES